MGLAIAETYALNPKFYSHTFCTNCRSHFPVGEFHWDDENLTTNPQVVGS
jgi:hypothetical protein